MQRPEAVARVEPETSARMAELNQAGLDVIRQYVLALVPEARRHKHYPAAAQQEGWEGTAEIAISLQALLPEPQVRLSRSSGYGPLDEAALSTVAAAVRRVGVPRALRGRDLTIAVPVQFRLED